MMRLFFCFAFFALFFSAHSNIAYPKPVVIDTPSGKMKVLLKGNENNKYAITEDGYTLLQDENGWYYAMKDDAGCVVKSSFMASPVDRQNNNISSFLRNQKKGLVPAPSVSSSYDKEMIHSHESNPVVGERKVLIVLVDFPDCPLTKTKADFNNLFNKKGYNEDGAKGSVVDYYNYVSYGKLDLQCDIVGPYLAKNKMSYYGKNTSTGGNDANVFSLFMEIVNQLSSEVSLAEYDSDKDGYIDNIHIVYAGYGEDAGAPANTIWAHESTFEPIGVQGLLIDRYSCAAELRSNRGSGISRIGPHCHEIGHALGAMDYYDTDYATNGNFIGTGYWDVMAAGSWNEDGACPANFNPYVKAYDFGWCSVESIASEGRVSLLPSSVSDIVYRIETKEEGEFFLLENRQREYFDASVPGEGMLIYHIDRDFDNKAIYDQINSGYPQCCYIVCASSTYRKPTSVAATYGDINSEGCPFPGTTNNTLFSINSTPAALCNDGSSAGFSIKDITDNSGIISMFVVLEEETPIIDPERSEEIVWSESFDSWLSLEPHWSSTNVEGPGVWNLFTYYQNYNNNSYIQLTSEGSMLNRARRSVSMLMSPSILFMDDDYVLSCKVHQNGDSFIGKDSIIVYLFNDKELIECYDATPCIGKWYDYSFQITNNSQQYLSIGIKGVCYTGTSLSVDDFVLRKKNNRETNITPLLNDDASTFMYSIWGTKEPLSIDKQGLFFLPNKKKVFIRN